MNQPLCANLSLQSGKDLFNRMVEKTSEYLKDYYDMRTLKV